MDSYLCLCYRNVEAAIANRRQFKSPVTHLSADSTIEWLLCSKWNNECRPVPIFVLVFAVNLPSLVRSLQLRWQLLFGFTYILRNCSEHCRHQYQTTPRNWKPTASGKFCVWRRFPRQHLEAALTTVEMRVPPPPQKNTFVSWWLFFINRQPEPKLREVCAVTPWRRAWRASDGYYFNESKIMSRGAGRVCRLAATVTIVHSTMLCSVLHWGFFFHNQNTLTF